MRSKNADEKDYDAPEVNEELDDANDRESETEEPNGGGGGGINESDQSGEEDLPADSNVVKDHMFANNYVYDREHHLWCELTFSVSCARKRKRM